MYKHALPMSDQTKITFKCILPTFNTGGPHNSTPNVADFIVCRRANQCPHPRCNLDALPLPLSPLLPPPSSCPLQQGPPEHLSDLNPGDSPGGPDAGLSCTQCGSPGPLSQRVIPCDLPVERVTRHTDTLQSPYPPPGLEMLRE